MAYSRVHHHPIPLNINFRLNWHQRLNLKMAKNRKMAENRVLEENFKKASESD